MCASTVRQNICMAHAKQSLTTRQTTSKDEDFNNNINIKKMMTTDDDHPTSPVAVGFVTSHPAAERISSILAISAGGRPCLSSFARHHGPFEQHRNAAPALVTASKVQSLASTVPA